MPRLKSNISSEVILSALASYFTNWFLVINSQQPNNLLFAEEDTLVYNEHLTP